MSDTEANLNNNVVINIPENDDLKKDNKERGIRKRLFEVIELAESGDIVSSIYDVFMITTIIVSLVPLGFKEDYIAFYYSDIVVVVIFIIDYILRFITADYRLKKNRLYLSLDILLLFGQLLIYFQFCLH